MSGLQRYAKLFLSSVRDYSYSLPVEPVVISMVFGAFVESKLFSPVKEKVGESGSRRTSTERIL
jgi:hypothetical protein